MDCQILGRVGQGRQSQEGNHTSRLSQHPAVAKGTARCPLFVPGRPSTGSRRAGKSHHHWGGHRPGTVRAAMDALFRGPYCDDWGGDNAQGGGKAVRGRRRDSGGRVSSIFRPQHFRRDRYRILTMRSGSAGANVWRWL